MYNNKNIHLTKKTKKIKSDDNFAFIWSLTTIAISIFIAVIILFAINASWISGIGSLIKQKTDNLIGNVKNSPGLALLGGRQNILLLGVDSNGNDTDPFKGTRSDTIIIISIDPFSKNANAISIPRDSKVYISNNYGIDKINAAHAFGGPGLSIKTIEDSFGININHYIAVNYQGLKEIVDAVGGVPVHVEKRMRYTDNSGGLRINLHPGYQILNSEEAEEYIRFRHDAMGDIGRMQRQQWFIRSLVKKLQSPGVMVKLPQLIQLANKYIKTDMNFYELSQLAAFSKSINLDSVQSATLPGKPSRYGRVSYWILDTEKTQEIINRLIYREQQTEKQEQKTVSILYPAEIEGRLSEIKDTLAQAGYSVTCDKSTLDPHSQIIAHSSYITLKNTNDLREKIPGLKKAQFIVSPDRYLCGESDFTLVLSNKEN
ncbi:MAG: LCP family protein [bacterium]